MSQLEKKGKQKSNLLQGAAELECIHQCHEGQ